MERNEVIVVDERDTRIGAMEKMEAHKKGVLHRAFSVFIFNSKGEMLLQQRAMSKYHSGGLWTNSVCSHPQPDEDTRIAAEKRLQEEMGFTTRLDKIYDFIYRAEMGNGLTEHEFDHVFVGEYDGMVRVNPQEVMDYSYKNVKEIRSSLQAEPHIYTAWFQLAFPRIEAWWSQHYKTMTA
jgi:isopentenyl-diphosphate delta-isomerase